MAYSKSAQDYLVPDFGAWLTKENLALRFVCAPRASAPSSAPIFEVSLPGLPETDGNGNRLVGRSNNPALAVSDLARRLEGKALLGLADGKLVTVPRALDEKSLSSALTPGVGSGAEASLVYLTDVAFRLGSSWSLHKLPDRAEWRSSLDAQPGKPGTDNPNRPQAFDKIPGNALVDLAYNIESKALHKGDKALVAGEVPVQASAAWHSIG